jgi:hypothetical protein
MVPEPNPDCQPEQFSMEIFTEIYQRKPKKKSPANGNFQLESGNVQLESGKFHL